MYVFRCICIFGGQRSMGSFLGCSPHHIFCTELGAHRSARLTGQLWGATCLYLPSAGTIGTRSHIRSSLTLPWQTQYLVGILILHPTSSTEGTTAKRLFRADGQGRGNGGLMGGGCGKSPAVQVHGMWPWVTHLRHVAELLLPRGSVSYLPAPWTH